MVLQQVMQTSVTIVNQVNALSDERNETSTGDERINEARLPGGPANNTYVRVVQPEDIGNAADADAAPAVTANCVCN
ncbi:MAG: hypothetical protein ACSLFL_09210 [Alphaproteobacteria bacterium]